MQNPADVAADGARRGPSVRRVTKTLSARTRGHPASILDSWLPLGRIASIRPEAASGGLALRPDRGFPPSDPGIDPICPSSLGS